MIQKSAKMTVMEMENAKKELVIVKMDFQEMLVSYLPVLMNVLEMEFVKKDYVCVIKDSWEKTVVQFLLNMVQ